MQSISVIDAVVLEMKCLQESPNEDRDGAEVTMGGSAFHARAPATGNARSPSEDRRVEEP